jgi:hypothetical protein
VSTIAQPSLNKLATLFALILSLVSMLPSGTGCLNTGILVKIMKSLRKWGIEFVLATFKELQLAKLDVLLLFVYTL